MEIEYSNEVKGKVHAYRFSKWERNLISACLAKEIKVRNRRIEKILNNPKNEGQVTFSAEIKVIEVEISELQEIITEFAKKR